MMRRTGSTTRRRTVTRIGMVVRESCWEGLVNVRSPRAKRERHVGGEQHAHLDILRKDQASVEIYPAWGCSSRQVRKVPAACWKSSLRSLRPGRLMDSVKTKRVKSWELTACYYPVIFFDNWLGRRRMSRRKDREGCHVS